MATPPVIRRAFIRRPRSLKRSLAFLAVMILLSAAGRMVWSNGVFSSVDTGFFGTCKVAGTLPGVQDMEIADGTVFIAAAGARGASAADGIYALKLSDGKLTRLAGTPKDFHPRGLGLVRSPDGRGLFLVVVNRRAKGGRFGIDTFEVTNPAAAPALVAQGMIEGGLLTDPQDVAATSPNTFYVANGTPNKNTLLHLAQSYGLLSGGNVLYFNGASFAQVAGGLYGTRSLVLSPDGSHLIVGGLLSRSLTSYKAEPFSGSLTEAGTLTLPAGPERLNLDGQGGVLVGGHANLLNWRKADPQKPSPSQVLRVTPADGVPKQAGQVYGNDGKEIAGAGVAVASGKRLLIGSSLDGRLLDCIQN